MKVTDLEPQCNGATEAARAALGDPTEWRMCVAVLLERGGDDGYWMRILGNSNFEDRRVGVLVVTPKRIAYAEVCAFKPRPRTRGRMLLTLARGGDNLLGFYKWTAGTTDIGSINVTPIRHTPHGTFATLQISAKGETMTFGLDAGATTQMFVSAVRHLAGAEHDVNGPSYGSPRTDGVYLFSAEKRSHKFDTVMFDEHHALYLSLNDVPAGVARIKSGEWKPDGRLYRREGEYTVISADDPDWERRAMILADGRLVLQAHHFRTNPSPFGNDTHEFGFVPYSELHDNWGRPSIPAPLPASDWPPILSPDGRLLAPDIGKPSARVKG